MTFRLFHGCRQAFPISRGLSWGPALPLSRPPHPPRATGPVPGRLVLCFILGSLLLAGCNANRAGSGATPTPSSSSATQLSPAWAAVLRQIGPTGEISLSTALQAYTVAFGPLPGAPTPPNPGGSIPSVTLAVRAILQHYADLTPAQQQVVLQRLSLTAPVGGAVAAPPASALVTAAPPLVIPAGPTPVPTDVPGTESYRAMLTEFIPKFDASLSYTLTLPIVLYFDPKLHGKSTGAYTDPIDAKGGFTGAPALCRIYVNPDESSSAVEDQRMAMAHELMHCYQAQILGSILLLESAPSWLIEGSATWTGAIVSGATVANFWLQHFWPYWLAFPGYPLFSRSYDALGFYALLDQAGISPWKVLIAMLTSQKGGPNNLAAYQEATKPASQQVLDEWASSYEREPALGPDWDLKGPGILPTGSYGAPPFQFVTLANGGHSAVTTPAYTALDDELTSEADVVLVNVSGTSRLKDSGSVEKVPSANGSYCTKQGGCTCPQGSPNQGVQLTQLTGRIHLAVTGGPPGAKGIVYGLSLTQFCGKTLPPATLAFCQQLLSLAEANQIMNPPAAATLIQVLPSHGVGGGLTTDGLCDYQSSPSVAGLVVQIRLGTYSGPTPISEDQVKEYFSQGLNQPGKADISVMPVSGVGDQAGLVVGSYAINGVTVYGAAFWVLYANIVFACNMFYASSPTPTQQSALQQCAQLVVSRLDP